MRKFPFILVLLLTLLVLPAQVWAQTSQPEIASLKIDLWPEYDRAEMLVIYRFSLTSETALPAQLTIRLPANAGNPHAVAVGSADELVSDVPYERRVNGDWADITFTAALPVVQFEYYDPNLEIIEADRSFVYHWPGDYVVDFLIVEVQEPVQTTGMQISPEMGTGERRDDGLVYRTLQVGPLAAGQTFDLQIDYQRSSNTLSVGEMDVEPSKELTSDTLGRINWVSALPWAVVIIGVALIVGGGVWYWRSGREDRKSHVPRSRRRAARRAQRAVESSPAGAPGAIYCHQCGHRAASGDRFCRSCGVKLRLE